MVLNRMLTAAQYIDVKKPAMYNIAGQKYSRRLAVG